MVWRGYVEAIMTIPFNSFNKEYSKQYLIGPTSHLTSHVGRLNLSTALGLKFNPVSGYERLKPQRYELLSLRILM